LDVAGQIIKQNFSKFLLIKNDNTPKKLVQSTVILQNWSFFANTEKIDFLQIHFV